MKTDAGGAIPAERRGWPGAAQPAGRGGRKRGRRYTEMTHTLETPATGNYSAGRPAGEAGVPWLTAIGSLIVGAAFFALWFWLLSRWLGFRAAAGDAAGGRGGAASPSVAGFAGARRCMWDFGWTGPGTPAP